jgi:hypothetical protein
VHPEYIKNSKGFWAAKNIKSTLGADRLLNHFLASLDILISTIKKYAMTLFPFIKKQSHPATGRGNNEKRH